MRLALYEQWYQVVDKSENGSVVLSVVALLWIIVFCRLSSTERKDNISQYVGIKQSTLPSNWNCKQRVWKVGTFIKYSGTFS